MDPATDYITRLMLLSTHFLGTGIPQTLRGQDSLRHPSADALVHPISERPVEISLCSNRWSLNTILLIVNNLKAEPNGQRSALSTFPTRHVARGAALSLPKPEKSRLFETENLSLYVRRFSPTKRTIARRYARNSETTAPANSLTRDCQAADATHALRGINTDGFRCSVTSVSKLRNQGVA